MSVSQLDYELFEVGELLTHPCNYNFQQKHIYSLERPSFPCFHAFTYAIPPWDYFPSTALFPFNIRQILEGSSQTPPSRSFSWYTFLLWSSKAFHWYFFAGTLILQSTQLWSTHYSLAICYPLTLGYHLLPISTQSSWFCRWGNWSSERLRDFAQSHTARKWQDHDALPGQYSCAELCCPCMLLAFVPCVNVLSLCVRSLWATAVFLTFMSPLTSSPVSWT